MNYTELVAAIENATENTFVTADINRIIKQAEQRIAQAVYLPVFRKTTTLTATLNSQFITAPDDFIAPDSLAVIVSGVYTYLLNKEPEFIREAYPTVTATGVPVHYGMYDVDDKFILGPTPAAAYSLQLQYFAYPTSIVSASTTWLGDNFDVVLFDACMAEAARFMKQSKEDIDIFEAKYTQSLMLLKNLGNGKLQQDLYRSGSARVQAI